MSELVGIVAGFDPELRPIIDQAGGPRGTRSGPQTVTLPTGWCDDRDNSEPPRAAAEVGAVGG